MDNAAVKAYLPLVQRIARKLQSRLPPQVSVDDLVQDGLIGLMEAERSYSGQGSFEKWAQVRIRGAMLDGLRGTDWAPRGVRRRIRRLRAVEALLEHELGRAVTAAEIAQRCRWPLADVHELAAVREPRTVEGLELIDDDALDSAALYERQRRVRAAAAVIGELPPRHQQALALHVDEGLSLRAVGKALGVTESRACQLVGQSLAKIKETMEWIDGKRK